MTDQEWEAVAEHMKVVAKIAMKRGYYCGQTDLDPDVKIDRDKQQMWAEAYIATGFEVETIKPYILKALSQ